MEVYISMKLVVVGDQTATYTYYQDMGLRNISSPYFAQTTRLKKEEKEKKKKKKG